MEVVLGADQAGFSLKEYIKNKLLEDPLIKIIDVSETPAMDFVDSSVAVAKLVTQDRNRYGIMFDACGVGSFLASNKMPGMITANVTDENTARMTRDHNNSLGIALGAEILGQRATLGLVQAFLSSAYAGGRHQVRVDMLNRM